ncbi:MAG: FAD-dependent oxidoreductase [Candidatus Poribacteria bacterium]|nr:FAD-dependent oxidoreductase [Candidatus Poribacteria bacterium]
MGEGFVGRDPGDTVALPAIPLTSARSFQSLIIPTVMGEQEELLVGQMNGFLLRSLLRFNVPDELSGGVPSGLTIDSLRVNLGIRSARLVENASLIALRPDSPWEELQTYVDTTRWVESEVLATPIPGAVTQVFVDRVRIDLPVSLLKYAVEAGDQSVEILLQPDGEAPFLLDIFSREATDIRADAPIPELEAVYRVGDVTERAAVQTDADTYWSATSEEMGFDTRLTGGGVFELLRGAWEAVPGIYELPLLETWTGLRPGSRDNAPILGKTPVENLIYATGHYRNGILLTPITAYEIAKLILTGETSETIAPFQLDRFLR